MVLFVNIASQQGLIACCSGGKICASEACNGKVSDAQIIPLIQRVIEASGGTFEDLSKIACVVGPGGFMSLRIAVSCVNTLADQLKIPVAGVHLNDLYRSRMQAQEVFWLHSTKKQELFACGGSWRVPTHLSVEEFFQQAPEHLLWCGELIDDHQRLCEEHRFMPAQLFPQEDVLPKLLEQLSYTKELLLPWYGRGM